MEQVIQVNPKRAAILQQRKIVSLEEENARLWARMEEISRAQEEQMREMKRLWKAIEKLQETPISTSYANEKIVWRNTAQSLEEDIDGLWKAMNEILAILGLND